MFYKFILFLLISCQGNPLLNNNSSQFQKKIMPFRTNKTIKSVIRNSQNCPCDPSIINSLLCKKSCISFQQIQQWFRCVDSDQARSYCIHNARLYSYGTCDSTINTFCAGSIKDNHCSDGLTPCGVDTYETQCYFIINIS